VLYLVEYMWYGTVLNVLFKENPMVANVIEFSEQVRSAALTYRGVGLRRIQGSDFYIAPSRNAPQGYAEISTAHVEGRTFFVFRAIGAE